MFIFYLMFFICASIVNADKCPSNLTSCTCNVYQQFTRINCYEISASNEEISKDFKEIEKTHSFTKFGAGIWLKNDKVTELGPHFFGNMLLTGIELTLPGLTKIDDMAFAGQEDTLRTVYLQRLGLENVPSGSLNRLKYLYMLGIFYCQRITVVKKTAFVNQANPGSIVYLFMDYNSIKTVETGAFSPLFNLKTLTLRGNKLTNFLASSLPGFLASLSLDNNPITTFPDGVLEHLVDHSKLFMNGNDISTISEETLKKVVNESSTRDIKVYLYGKTLRCNCNFEYLASYKIKQNLKLYGYCSLYIGDVKSNSERKSLGSLTVEDFKKC